MIKKKFLFINLSAGGMLRILLKSTPAIFTSVLFAVVAVYAWTEPSVAPPGNNVAAPINIGSVTQQKSGSMTVAGAIFEAFNEARLATVSGRVGIGGFGSFGSPGKLDVVSAAGGTSIRLTDNTNSTLTISHPSGGKVSFADGGGTTWLTESAGNVGIGSADTPSQRLEIFGGDAQITKGTPRLFLKDAGGTGMRFALEHDTTNGRLKIQRWNAVGWEANLFEMDRASGNAGIGTSDLGTYKLNIAGDANASRLCIAGNCQSSWPSGADSDWIISGTNMYSGVSGNVGIGTPGPAKKLQVNDGDGIFQYGDTSGVSVFNAEGSAGEVRLGAAWGRPGVYSSTNLNLLGTSGLSLSGRGNATDLYIDSLGNVGIGTSALTPGIKLEVNGWIKITGGNPGSNRILTSDAVGTAFWALPSWLGGSGSMNYVPKFTSGTTLGNSQIQDTGTGVGMGTTPTQAKLEVEGLGPTVGGIMFRNSNTIKKGWLYAIASDEPVSYDEELVLSFGNLGTDRSSIFIGPNITAGNQSGRVEINALLIDLETRNNTGIISLFGYTEFKQLPIGLGTRVSVDANGRLYKDSSSLRYKENIRPLEDQFDKILSLEPKIFNYKASEKEDVGFIAEEFDEAGLKNLVVYNEEGQPDALKYDRIPLYLLEVIKSQQKEIESLKDKVDLISAKLGL